MVWYTHEYKLLRRSIKYMPESISQGPEGVPLTNEALLHAGSEALQKGDLHRAILDQYALSLRGVPKGDTDYRGYLEFQNTLADRLLSDNKKGTLFSDRLAPLPSAQSMLERTDYASFVVAAYDHLSSFVQSAGTYEVNHEIRFSFPDRNGIKDRLINALSERPENIAERVAWSTALHDHFTDSRDQDSVVHHASIGYFKDVRREARFSLLKSDRLADRVRVFSKTATELAQPNSLTDANVRVVEKLNREVSQMITRSIDDYIFNNEGNLDLNKFFGVGRSLTGKQVDYETGKMFLYESPRVNEALATTVERTVLNTFDKWTGPETTIRYGNGSLREIRAKLHASGMVQEKIDEATIDNRELVEGVGVRNRKAVIATLDRWGDVHMPEQVIQYGTERYQQARLALVEAGLKPEQVGSLLLGDAQFNQHFTSGLQQVVIDEMDSWAKVNMRKQTIEYGTDKLKLLRDRLKSAGVAEDAIEAMTFGDEQFMGKIKVKMQEAVLSTIDYWYKSEQKIHYGVQRLEFMSQSLLAIGMGPDRVKQIIVGDEEFVESFTSKLQMAVVGEINKWENVRMYEQMIQYGAERLDQMRKGLLDLGINTNEIGQTIFDDAYLMDEVISRLHKAVLAEVAYWSKQDQKQRYGRSKLEQMKSALRDIGAPADFIENVAISPVFTEAFNAATGITP